MRQRWPYLALADQRRSQPKVSRAERSTLNAALRRAALNRLVEDILEIMHAGDGDCTPEELERRHERFMAVCQRFHAGKAGRVKDRARKGTA